MFDTHDTAAHAEWDDYVPEALDYLDMLPTALRGAGYSAAFVATFRYQLGIIRKVATSNHRGNPRRIGKALRALDALDILHERLGAEGSPLPEVVEELRRYILTPPGGDVIRWQHAITVPDVEVPEGAQWETLSVDDPRAASVVYSLIHDDGVAPADLEGTTISVMHIPDEERTG